ncbi:MAG: hypothetical protein J6U58_01230 [Bacteroidaceae bacterium]|nr:hypothetical protein [Bacteroidaceae bacterium]
MPITKYKSSFFVVIIASVLLFGCKDVDPHMGRTPLASIADVFLYKDEVDLMYATYGQMSDSTTFYDNYIEQWATEMLFYEKASENIASTDEIDKLVEGYRRSLVLSLYQEGLIAQHLIHEISEKDVADFYEYNESLFEIEEPLVRGILLKVPERAPRINKLRTWCISRKSEALDELEKYSLVNDVVYDNFLYEWRTFASLVKATPLTEYQLSERLSRNKTIEFKDKGFVYFVGVDTIIKKGERKPLELVESEIRELLVNSRKANFIKEMKHAIYNEAQVAGKVWLNVKPLDVNNQK